MIMTNKLQEAVNCIIEEHIISVYNSEGPASAEAYLSYFI